MEILIVGLGSIAKKHIDAIKKNNQNHKIFALRSSNKSPQYLDVQNIHNINQLLKKPDFVIISNPTSKHAKSLKDFFSYNLFIEKPIVHSKIQLKKVVNQYLNYNSISYVACNLRFLDSLIFVKNYLKKDSLRINEVNIYAGSNLQEWRPNKDYKSIYSSIKKLGGGVHLDLIHEIDYCYWFFGKPIRVQKNFSNNSSLNIDSFDYANYLLSYKEFTANIILNYYRNDKKRTCEIVCSHGTILVDLFENKVFENGKLIFSSNQAIIETYNLQINYYINCLEENKSTFNSFHNGKEVLEICL
ncbi:MAG: Gfo/Idh/MocA family oxidoreductase [Bacteroidota bacterium]|jgi:predicted dehydrogenase